MRPSCPLSARHCPTGRLKVASPSVENLSDLKDHFPDSRTMIFPHVGHSFGIGGCLSPILAGFVDRRPTTKGLDITSCDGAVVVPPFDLTD